MGNKGISNGVSNNFDTNDWRLMMRGMALNDVNMSEFRISGVARCDILLVSRGMEALYFQAARRGFKRHGK
jgi:hypothetical protein